MPYSALACIRSIKIRVNVVTLDLQNYLYIKRPERNSEAEMNIFVKSCTLFFPTTSTSCPKGKKPDSFILKTYIFSFKVHNDWIAQ